MKSGAALLIVVLVSGAIMALGVIGTKMVYNTCTTVQDFAGREQAFWLAESALELGRARLVSEPGWYTDLPHSPEPDLDWIKNKAFGETIVVAAGTIKVVREMGKENIWGIGTKGRAVVVLRRQGTRWEEF